MVRACLRNEVLKGILPQYPNPFKPILNILEDWIDRAPLTIKVHQVSVKLKIVAYPSKGFGLSRLLISTNRSRRKDRAVEERISSLSEANYAIAEAKTIFMSW